MGESGRETGGGAESLLKRECVGYGGRKWCRERGGGVIGGLGFWMGWRLGFLNELDVGGMGMGSRVVGALVREARGWRDLQLWMEREGKSI